MHDNPDIRPPSRRRGSRLGLLLLLLFPAAVASGQLGSWAQHPPYPIARSGHAAAMSGLQVYVMGGRNGAANYDSLHVSTYANAGMSPSAWTALAPMGVSRYCAAAAAAPGGRIYVFGGYLGGGGTPSASVQEYNPGTNTWSARAPMPAPRARMQAVTVNGLIYLTGGVNNLGTATNTVFVYNPGTNTWGTAAPMATARADHAATAYAHFSFTGQRLVVSGGRTGIGGAPMASVEVYDPMTLAWTAPPWGLPAAVYGHAMAHGPLTQWIVVGGGIDGGGTVSDAYHRGSPAAWGGWAPMAIPLGRPMAHLHLFGHNNAWNGSEDIIALGGLTTGSLPVGNYEVMFSTIVLPQSQVRLQAVADGPVVRLAWEQQLPDAVGYALERSADGSTFAQLQASPCPAASLCQTVDAAPLRGYNHYRIVVQRQDGSIAYSQVATALFSTAAPSAQLVPATGPGARMLRYLLPAGEAVAALHLMGMDGRAHRSWTLHGTQGEQELDLAGIASGAYVLHLRTQESALSIRFFLE